MAGMMLGDRQAQVPAELVIWGSTAALGLVSGIGAAFVLWNMLHRSPAQGIADAAVTAIAVGLGLIGFASSNLTARLFLLIVSATALLAFFAGAGAFAALTGS
jgi:hypothetical protein